MTDVPNYVTADTADIRAVCMVTSESGEASWRWGVLRCADNGTIYDDHGRQGQLKRLHVGVIANMVNKSNSQAANDTGGIYRSQREQRKVVVDVAVAETTTKPMRTMSELMTINH